MRSIDKIIKSLNKAELKQLEGYLLSERRKAEKRATMNAIAFIEIIYMYTMCECLGCDDDMTNKVARAVNDTCDRLVDVKSGEAIDTFRRKLSMHYGISFIPAIDLTSWDVSSNTVVCPHCGAPIDLEEAEKI